MPQTHDIAQTQRTWARIRTIVENAVASRNSQETIIDQRDVTGLDQTRNLAGPDLGFFAVFGSGGGAGVGP